MKEQIQFITNYARTCLMMARIMPGDSRLHYINEGKKSAQMALDLQRAWMRDMTKEYKMVA